MAAAQSPCMDKAARKLYDANADFIMREKAWALEENLRRERKWEATDQKLAEATATLAEQTATLAEQTAVLAEKDATIAALRAELDRLRAQTSR